jgi:hypothetical protein
MKKAIRKRPDVGLIPRKVYCGAFNAACHTLPGPIPPPAVAGFRDTSLWFFAGQDATGRDGNCVIHLNEHLYLPRDLRADHHSCGPQIVSSAPQFVALPVSEEPSVLTSTVEANGSNIDPIYTMKDLDYHDLTPEPSQAYDIKIEVQSWSLGREKIGWVRFSFICVIEGAVCVRIGF